MKNPYRLIIPSPGWARILWSDGVTHSSEILELMDLVAAVPGCQRGVRYFEAPHTTWMLEDWCALAQSCGVGLPVRGHTFAELDLELDREPYPFQREAIDFATLGGQALIADEMGLGKTTEAIFAAEQLRRRTDGTAVIVAPLMVRDTWRRELLAIGAIKSEDEFCAVETRNIDHPSFRRYGVTYYFVHYDVARAWWSRLNSLGPRRPVVAIVDEAHAVRNSRTQRAQGTLMLAGTCKYRVLLTGTPLDNRPSDLWNPLTITTGPRTWGGPLEFRKRYAGAWYNGHGWQDGEDPTHVEELRARLKPFYLRRTVDEVGLELPPLTRSSVRSSLEGARRREHDDVLAGASVATVVRAVARGAIEQVLPVLTRLRQITSVAKVGGTAEYVGNLLDQGESPVVFCWEREAVHRLVGRIDGHTLAVEGSMSQDLRDDKVRRFQEDRREPIALVATMGALREGVTLHRSRIVIMHDLHWVLSHMLQAEKRIHRIGQCWPCQSIWMLADMSIDTILAPVLLRKAELMKDVLGIDAQLESLDLAELAGEDAVELQVERALRAWSAA